MRAQPRQLPDHRTRSCDIARFTRDMQCSAPVKDIDVKLLLDFFQIMVSLAEDILHLSDGKGIGFFRSAHL